MIDISLIRQNPDLIRKNIKKKFQDEKLKVLEEIIKKDEKWRKLKSEIDSLRAERNVLSKQISEAKKERANDKNLLKKAKQIPQEIARVEEKERRLKESIDSLLKQIPTILHESVPIGKSAKDNVVREVIGIPKKFDFSIKNHTELAEELGLADFETSAEITGNGFYILKNDLALLNQALINYSRDFMVSKGYEYIEPPLMIRKKVLEGVYSKSEIDAMSYKIEGEDLYLIATSEHPVIGMFIGKTLNHKDLPLKLTAYSMCFRKEIGSHGIDEKGLFRTHQFNKQEMVVICEPKDSYKYYKELMDLSKELFKKLKIPIREYESCSADLGDLKAKGADLEFWRPRTNEYNEIGSVTNMEEAQARRLNIKYFNDKGERRFVHTLNNTAIATSRAMVAILENCQQKDGTIKIPDVLIPYMDGKKFIGKK
ncbi:MAG: serine--tRNA ligase [Candidatus Pacearchaeota archaeon]|nr:serine--tRNA ligase [Candidatus Pacearchaeota archaeon]